MNRTLVNILAVIGVLALVFGLLAGMVGFVVAVSRAGGAGGGTVAVIHVDGVIAEDAPAGGLLGGAGTGATGFVRLVHEAEVDPTIKAIVVRVNSPGGGVVASSEMYKALVELRTKFHKPVVVSMADEAASGGYYISCAADRIYANADTITGSIGVIMHLMYLQGLYDKIGVKEEIIKSGPHKDIGSRPVTPEERQILQNLIDDAYGGFLNVVATRPSGPWNGNPDLVRPVADGSVFSGKRALDKGLVDKIGDLKEAEQGAAQLAGIDGTPRIVVLEQKTTLFGSLQNRLATDPTRVQVTVPQLGGTGPGYSLEYLALPPGQ